MNALIYSSKLFASPLKPSKGLVLRDTCHVEHASFSGLVRTEMDPVSLQIKNFTKVTLGWAASLLDERSKTALKRRMELRYWRRLHKNVQAEFKSPDAAKAELLRHRAHYEKIYTTLFGLTKSFYDGKKVLDIGCGPLGSLEWADNALMRVGLDPLAEQYKLLAGDSHSMTYVQAPSEQIPYGDGEFDVVTLLNSLDHVDDFDKTLSEVKRVTKPGGRIIIVTEIDHQPTLTEPHTFTADQVLNGFLPACTVLEKKIYGMRSDHWVWKSIDDDMPHVPGAPGLLCTMLEVKRAENGSQVGSSTSQAA